MHVYIVSILWAMALVGAKRYVPRVTKSRIESPRNLDDSPFHPSPPDFARFGDSDIVMLGLEKSLHISFDDGENWKTVDEIGQREVAYVDQFHQERGFVTTRAEKTQEIHVTEDQGRSWRRLAIPREVKENGFCHITTHPFDYNSLLLDCDISVDNEKYLGRIVYASNDAGKSFRHIVGAPNYLPDFLTYCSFAASSRESTLESDGIYCIHTIDKPTNPDVIDLNETPVQQEHQSVGAIFYTTDLGRTKKVFDELKGFSVEGMFILPHSVGVITSEGSRFRDDHKLWISKGTSFKLARLPEKLTIQGVGSLPGDDQGRLLLDASACVEHKTSSRLLVSDSSGLNFSFLDSALELAIPGRIWNSVVSISLKGMLWGKFRFYNDIEEKENLLQKALNPHQIIYPHQTISMTKGSFDNGKTWTNLKVVDPSGEHRHLFNCNIDDVEHCSFQIGYDHPPIEKSMAGIIIRTGTVGERYDPKVSENRVSIVNGIRYVEAGGNEMTFISRDGGASWEVAFEFPVKAVFLDFGNIIVAIRNREEYRDGEFKGYTKFFFSLDQGRTWSEYRFDKPIRASDVELQVHDLKAYMGFSSFNEESIEYIFYTIDFSNAFDGTACTEDDLETWYLSNGKCIDGMRYSYTRRKPNAKCLMRKTFGKLELHEERCV